jgi:hypothetical protein
MPSPIAHLAAALVIYELARGREPEPRLPAIGPVPGLLVVTATLSMLPDADSVVGVLAGDFGRYHNNASHSLLVGLLVAIGFAAVMRRLKGNAFGYWFVVALSCYTVHIFMDSATWSRGVMALWPATDQRFLFPVTLFYGLHWSQGMFSLQHLWTIFTESLFAGLLFILLYFRPWRAKVEAEA